VTRTIRVTVNGRQHERAVEVRATLADFLREDLDLTGTHVGCEHGVCGACTVLLEGEPVRACLMLAAQADGHRVETIEGVAPADGLHPIQEAFWAKHGLQCGYCTPGIIMSATAFLREHPAPSDAEIREMLAGHLCRCTGYHFIVEAVAAAARALAAGERPGPRAT
jgi:carbon-monoxide dehydrogenase small subunit